MEFNYIRLLWRRWRSSTLITVLDAPNVAPEAASTASADGVQDSDISGQVAIFTPVHDGDSDADDVVVTISSEYRAMSSFAQCIVKDMKEIKGNKESSTY